MRKVAIVGNIASGKSEVKNILLDFGYKVLDTDIVCHEILEINENIKKQFAEFDVFEGQKISRQKLGNLVFNDKNLLNKLESIIHPIVKDKIIEFFNENQTENIIFVEIPLLFEAGMENLFDDILFVYAPDDIRKNRLITRNRFSTEYAQLRMDTQLSQEDKVKRASIVITNDASLVELKQKLESLFKQ